MTRGSAVIVSFTPTCQLSPSTMNCTQYESVGGTSRACGGGTQHSSSPPAIGRVITSVGAAGRWRLATCCDLKLFAENEFWQSGQNRLPGRSRRSPPPLAPEWNTSSARGQRYQITRRRICARKKKSAPRSTISKGCSTVFGPSHSTSNDSHGWSSASPVASRHDCGVTVFGCSEKLRAAANTSPALMSAAICQWPPA